MTHPGNPLLTRCPMPRSGGRHRLTGGWKRTGPDDHGGETCSHCHQVWVWAKTGEAPLDHGRLVELTLIPLYDFLSLRAAAKLDGRTSTDGNRTT